MMQLLYDMVNHISRKKNYVIWLREGYASVIVDVFIFVENALSSFSTKRWLDFEHLTNQI